eukprot:COSAG01_NODE_12774_length_1688_cov_1.138452_1_plen_179_part_00
MLLTSSCPTPLSSTSSGEQRRPASPARRVPYLTRRQQQQLSKVLTAIIISIICCSLQLSAAVASEPRLPKKYRVEIVSRPTKPLVSWANPVGHGHSPFQMTFNPSYLPPSDGFDGGLLVRLANGSKGAEHIGFVPCDLDNATGDVTCKDLDASFVFAPAGNVQDPRAFLYQGWYYNFL